MARITIKRGSEGPRHDPYAYTEITFHFTDPKRAPVTLHESLGDWLKIGDHADRSLKAPSARFEALTGLSLRRAEQIPHELIARAYRQHARTCGGPIECVAGYPGETFEMCRKCGAVVDSRFDRSAIE